MTLILLCVSYINTGERGTECVGASDHPNLPGKGSETATLGNSLLALEAFGLDSLLKFPLALIILPLAQLKLLPTNIASCVRTHNACKLDVLPPDLINGPSMLQP